MTNIPKLTSDYLNCKAMIPGSLIEVYTVCGKKNCRCKDKENPRKHGPQLKLSSTIKGKRTVLHIKKDQEELATRMANEFTRHRNIEKNLLQELVATAKEKGLEYTRDQMEKGVEKHQKAITDEQKSFQKKLDSLKKSRDSWKEKAMLRRGVTLNNQVTTRDLTSSRDSWKNKATERKVKCRDLQKKLRDEEHLTSMTKDRLSDALMELEEINSKKNGK